MCARELLCCLSRDACNVVLNFSLFLNLFISFVILTLELEFISSSGTSTNKSDLEIFFRGGCRGEIGKQSVKSAAEPKYTLILKTLYYEIYYEN